MTKRARLERELEGDLGDGIPVGGEVGVAFDVVVELVAAVLWWRAEGEMGWGEGNREICVHEYVYGETECRF